MPPSPRVPRDEDPIEPSGAGLLRGRSPREIMRRLADGDPLGLGPKIHIALDEGGCLVDPTRLHLRLLARIAYQASIRPPPHDLAPWLRARLAESISELLAEDCEAERGAAQDEGFTARYTSLCRPLGLDPACGRRFSVAFHALPFVQRRIIRAAMYDGMSCSGIARALGRTESDVESSLRTALGSMQRSVAQRASEAASGKSSPQVAMQSGGEMLFSAAHPRDQARAESEAHSELAELLHQLCRTRLLEDERSIGYFSRYSGLGLRVESIPEAVLQSRVCDLDAAFPGVVWTSAECEARALLANAESAKADVTHLARLGYRMIPRDEWRMFAAMAHMLDGQVEAAADLARRTLEGAPSNAVRLRCLELLSMSSVSRGEVDQALRYSKQACALRPDYPLGEMNRVIFALLAGHESEALCGSARLHELVGASHEMVDARLLANLERKQRGPWYSSPASRELVRKLSGRLKPAARLIAQCL